MFLKLMVVSALSVFPVMLFFSVPSPGPVPPRLSDPLLSKVTGRLISPESRRLSALTGLRLHRPSVRLPSLSFRVLKQLFLPIRGWLRIF